MSEESKEKGIDFFGKVDRDAYGNIKSEFPAWYFETHLDNLREEHATLIRRLERGEIPLEHQPYARQDAAAIKAKIDQIDGSRPTIRDNERAILQKHYKELAGKISASLFTRSEMKMGTAEAHEEARRMVKPCIPISPPLKPLAKTANVKVEASKVSRNGAIKMWKIIARLIGEGTNVEALRRDAATVVTGA